MLYGSGTQANEGDICCFGRTRLTSCLSCAAIIFCDLLAASSYCWLGSVTLDNCYYEGFSGAFMAIGAFLLLAGSFFWAVEIRCILYLQPMPSQAVQEHKVWWELTRLSMNLLTVGYVYFWATPDYYTAAFGGLVLIAGGILLVFPCCKGRWGRVVARNVVTLSTRMTQPADVV